MKSRFSPRTRGKGVARFCGGHGKAPVELSDVPLAHERTVSHDSTLQIGPCVLQLEKSPWRATLAGCRVTGYQSQFIIAMTFTMVLMLSVFVGMFSQSNERRRKFATRICRLTDFFRAGTGRNVPETA